MKEIASARNDGIGGGYAKYFDNITLHQNTGMNQILKHVPSTTPQQTKAAGTVVFNSTLKHPHHVTHPIKCPFDYLFALKPKNPV